MLPLTRKFVDALFQSVAEDGGKAQTEAEEMEISTRSRGKNILSNRTKYDIHIYLLQPFVWMQGSCAL